MSHSIDWSAIDLVIFDVDGTLYEQERLHRRMAVEVAIGCARTLDPGIALTLREFRRVREELAEEGARDFLRAQYEITAGRIRRTPGEVASLVEEWMERRPIAFLRACRSAGVDLLMERLRQAGKLVGVLSDYPAVDKLAALGLAADIIVSAGDPEVMALKPDPAGVLRILRLGGVAPQRALMIGDRDERDGEAGRRAGVRPLIRSNRKGKGDFRRYDDPVFRSLPDASPPTMTGVASR
jgi:phosphoglycolate phosphatase/putative hydrolase of the HAD superfamily